MPTNKQKCLVKEKEVNLFDIVKDKHSSELENEITTQYQSKQAFRKLRIK